MTMLHRQSSGSLQLKMTSATPPQSDFVMANNMAMRSHLVSPPFGTSCGGGSGHSAAAVVEEPRAPPRNNTIGPKKRRRNNKKNTTVKLLEDSFEPAPNDVICARGNRAISHPGNQRMQNMVQQCCHEYSQTTRKLDKTAIVTRIISDIQALGGRFVRQQDHHAAPGGGGGTWAVVSDQAAREKVGQRFRDLLDVRYKSSTKAKKRKRTQQLQASIMERYNEDEDDVNMLNRPSPMLVEGVVVDDLTPLALDEPYPLSRDYSTSLISTSTRTHDDPSPNAATEDCLDPEDVHLERVFQQANKELLHKIKSLASGSNDEEDKLSSSQQEQHPQESTTVVASPSLTTSVQELSAQHISVLMSTITQILPDLTVA